MLFIRQGLELLSNKMTCIMSRIQTFYIILKPGFNRGTPRISHFFVKTLLLLNEMVYCHEKYTHPKAVVNTRNK